MSAAAPGGADWLGAADRALGLRAWGLILYGALPANLALLGVLEVKLAKVAEPGVLFLLLSVSAVPLLLLFLLVRSRHREWYLTTDFLNLRSAAHALVILLLAALVFGLSGLVLKGYEFAPRALAACDPSKLAACWPLKGVVESFLFAVGSLVLSSTLFMSVMTKGGDLPGLPAGEFTRQLGAIRQKLLQVQAAPVWQASGGDCRAEAAKDAKKLIGDLQSAPGHRLAKRSLKGVEADLKEFLIAADYLDVADKNVRAANWTPYFAPPGSLSETQQLDRDSKAQTYAALRRLKGLKLGG
ncbi:MAG TPA: hypothetical protein VF591_19165 [Pyrinomonadaceae bacterium]|jgi:hypothetical protein